MKSYLTLNRTEIVRLIQNKGPKFSQLSKKRGF